MARPTIDPEAWTGVEFWRRRALERPVPGLIIMVVALLSGLIALAAGSPLMDGIGLEPIRGAFPTSVLIWGAAMAAVSVAATVWMLMRRAHRDDMDETGTDAQP